MELELVNNIISESRLYRASGSFSRLKGEAIAELLYVTTLSVVILSKDKKQETWARAYAQKTASAGLYSIFKSNATDIYALAYQVNVPDSKSTKATSEATGYLERLQFDPRQHNRVMQAVGNGTDSTQQLTSFFIGLERQLKITVPRFKTWRRYAIIWDTLSPKAREDIIRMIKRELSLLGKGTEIQSKLETMLTYHSFDSADDAGPSLLQKAGATVAGAMVGKTLGSKVDTAIGGESDKYSKIGTGLGGIAGYWASKKMK